MSTYVDALNRSIALEQPPQRIVSLVPSITEALFTFGLRDEIAGVTQFCSEPRIHVAGKPKVGGTKTLDVRAVLDLQPDLVIATPRRTGRKISASCSRQDSAYSSRSRARCRGR